YGALRRDGSTRQNPLYGARTDTTRRRRMDSKTYAGLLSTTDDAGATHRGARRVVTRSQPSSRRETAETWRRKGRHRRRDRRSPFRPRLPRELPRHLNG